MAAGACGREAVHLMVYRKQIKGGRDGEPGITIKDMPQ
jgi:hypothetical protein